MRRIAVLVSGYGNFGKSGTLYALSERKRGEGVEIAGKWFYLQRKSNSAITEYFEIIESLAANKKVEYILLAFCPDFDDPEKRSEEVLKLLARKGCEIYSFVLMQNYNGKKSIKESDFLKLKEYSQDVFKCDKIDIDDENKAKWMRAERCCGNISKRFWKKKLSFKTALKIK